MHNYNKKVLYTMDRDLRKSQHFEHASLVEREMLRDKLYQYNLGMSDEGSDVDDELRKQKK